MKRVHTRALENAGLRGRQGNPRCPDVLIQRLVNSREVSSAHEDKMGMLMFPPHRDLGEFSLRLRVYTVPVQCLARS